MKIFISGDFCPINRIDLIQSNSIELLDDTIKDILCQADLRITNLECPLTEHLTPIRKTGPALKADPKNIQLLINNTFNLVTLANNHIMDYGSRGIQDTMQLLKEHEIEYIGAGSINEDIDVIYKTKGDFTVGIINVCENEWSTDENQGYKANGLSEICMFYCIKKVKENADKVIVIHHGGHEMYNLPSPRLKKTLRFFVDCGADVVINHHTHCIGGYETYKQSPIFYSLGNFVFDNPKQRNSIWNYGMAVTLECGKEGIKFQRHYFEQCNAEARVNLVDEKDLKYDIKELNNIISNDDQLEKKFKEFIQQKKKMYLSYLEPSKSKYILALINRGLFPSFWNKRKRYYLKNLITCESHCEVVKTLLKHETSHT
ncbi:CapA family protein [Aequorivita viscosa]|nr:CapA family protein [Aequorivita viscosa]